MGELFEPLLADRGEQLDRAVFELDELLGVDVVEQRDGVGIPAPPQVIGKLLQALQTLREVRQDSKSTQRPRRHDLPRIPSKNAPGGRARTCGRDVSRPESHLVTYFG